MMVGKEKATRVGRPPAKGKLTKNAEAVRRCRDKKNMEFEKIKEENAALKKENSTLILKAQQQSAKIEQLEQQLQSFQLSASVDPRDTGGSFLGIFNPQPQRAYNRRYYDDYPRPINVQQELNSAYPMPLTAPDYGTYSQPQ